MVDIDLEAIRRRMEAATPGPWRADDSEIYGSTHGVWVGETLQDVDPVLTRANAEFIAAARSDVGDLLALVDELRAQLARVEGVVDATQDAAVARAQERIVAYRASPTGSAGTHAAGLVASLETLMMHLRGTSRAAVRLLVEQQQTRLEIDRLTGLLNGEPAEDAPRCSVFAPGDIVNVEPWGSAEFRVTGHTRLRGDDGVFRDLVDVVMVGESGISGHERPGRLTMVRPAGGDPR